jgi:hypothetical protein
MEERGTLRIKIFDLPEREANGRQDAIDLTLRRLGTPEGSACERDCDCRIGLVCVRGLCSEKE